MNPSLQERRELYKLENFVESIEKYSQSYAKDIDSTNYFGFPTSSILNAENALLSNRIKSTAYFSMEFGLAPSIYNSFQVNRPVSDENKFFIHEVFSNHWSSNVSFNIQIDKMLDIPIYGGGLGVLAGDTLKSAADLAYSTVGIGVLWHKGYFKQDLRRDRGQIPEEQLWNPNTYPGLVPLKNIVIIDTNEGPLYLRLWKYFIYSFDKKNVCPLILLDANLEQNPEHFRRLTDQLYRSDDVWWKIFQRAILGIGGVKALDSLRYSIDCYHLNEGHAAFALLEKYITLDDKAKMDQIKQKFVFTCHTPVAAGHDRFHINDVSRVLKREYVDAAKIFGKESPDSDQINLTFMSLHNCPKVNAVSAKHGEIMRLQFPEFAPKIQSITNGVHIHTWLSDSFEKLFDKYGATFNNWRNDPKQLANIDQLRGDDKFRNDLFEAHQQNKRGLIAVEKILPLRDDVLTIGWARRFANYKRPSLIFHNIKQLVELAHELGPLQIIIAGKAHPNDNVGAAHILEIFRHLNELWEYKDVVKVIILENYDTFFGKLLTNSVDVWLNNPLPPFEASGTSGMKAILNGVLQMSTVDGWIVEAQKDDIGWFFGYQHSGPEVGSEYQLRLDEDSKELNNTLKKVLELYRQTYSNGKINSKSPWIDKMINCVRKSAFFNTQRMIEEYRKEIWQF